MAFQFAANGEAKGFIESIISWPSFSSANTQGYDASSGSGPCSIEITSRTAVYITIVAVNVASIPKREWDTFVEYYCLI